MKTIDNRLSAYFGIAILGAMLCLAPGDAASAAAPQEAAPHWDYEEHGPATWGAASPAFVACSERVVPAIQPFSPIQELL